jgi:phospholipase/lecithinase/hemolysin
MEDTALHLTTARLPRVLAVLCLTAAWISPASAGPSFTQIVAFGDSLSDTGNYATFNPNLTPPLYQGRASNGPIWLDYLSTKLGVPDPTPSALGGTNYAWFSATAGNLNSFVPNLSTQIQSYLGAVNGKADPNTLYTVWAGANDLFDGQTDASVPSGIVASAVGSLLGAGARHVLVGNMPDLGHVPIGISTGPAEAAMLNTLSLQFNADLSAGLSSLKAAYPGAAIDVLDANGLLERGRRDPGEFGFTDVVDPLYYALQNNPNIDPATYAFWDYYHPTTAAGVNIAKAALLAVVPEPGGLALAGVCIASLALKIRRQKSR